MRLIFQEMFSDVKQAHENLYLYLKSIRESLRGMPEAEKCDLCFALRECAELAEDMEKECRKTFESIEKEVCIEATKRGILSGAIEKIETEHCSATPDVKEIQVVPRYVATDEVATQKYYDMLRWLGIDENLWDRGKELYAEGEIDTKVVDVHWPGLQGYFQRLKAAGFPLPNFIDVSKAYQKYVLRIRKKKGVMSE